MENNNTPGTELSEKYNNRVGVRFTCHGLSSKLKFRDTEEVDATVKDISLDGLCVEVEQKLDIEKSSQLKVRLFDRSCDLDKDIQAFLIKENKHDEKYIYHLMFKSSQRPESLQHFNMFFSVPATCLASRKQRNENQKSLAEKDVDALHRSIRNLKTCQFQLVLTSIPILFGVLGTLISFISSKKANDIDQLYMFLPPVSVILAFLLLAVFIQKMESIRRSSAFILLLQRHLAFGSFPSCYRGWQDAFENYSHHVRHGFLKSSPFDVEPFQETKIRHRVPADSFTWLALAIFTLSPIVSMILMFLVLAKDKGMGNGSYTLVVIVVTIIFCIAAFLLYRKLISLKYGKRSFRYLVVLFSKILKYSPPFDPYNNNPLEVQHLSLKSHITIASS